MINSKRVERFVDSYGMGIKVKLLTILISLINLLIFVINISFLF